MKNIPLGNGALSVAHAGHELRLHGFLEKSKPYIFVLSEGAKLNAKDSLMLFSWKYISEVIDKKDCFGILTLKNPDESICYINDSQIYTEILLGNTGFFGMYMSMMIQNFQKKKIDYVICDASEGTNAIHELCRIMTDICVKYIQNTTGKKIMNYEYSVNTPFNRDLTDACIHVELDDEAFQRKIVALLSYHPSILQDLKPDISLDMNIVSEYRKSKHGAVELKKIIEEIHPAFFRNEYIRPYIYKEPTEKPLYEVREEQLVAQGALNEAISYEGHIKPLKAKLEKLMLGEPVIQ